MKDAQQKWPFLTNFDRSMIGTAGQLSSVIKVRASISEQRTEKGANAWTQGKQF